MASKCLEIIIVTNKIHVHMYCMYVCMYVHRYVGLFSALRKMLEGDEVLSPMNQSRMQHLLYFLSCCCCCCL